MKRIVIYGQINGLNAPTPVLSEDGWFYCLICGLGFDEEYAIISHMNPHPPGAPADAARLKSCRDRTHAFPAWVASRCARCGARYTESSECA